MSFSDLLSLIEILVTILFGYYITHWVTVRDTRTRSVKDLYLEQLNDIKKSVDSFFNDLFDCKLNGRTIADWYGHQQEKLICFDEGLRLALPIRKRKIEEIVNDIHEEVTGSDYYNDHFKDRKYQMNKAEQVKMNALRAKVDKAFNEYIIQINNSRQYYFWEVIKQNYRFDLDYFKSQNVKSPELRAVRIRLQKSFPYLVFISIVILIFIGAHHSFSSAEEETLKRDSTNDAHMERLLEEVNTLDESINRITEEIKEGTKTDSCLMRSIVIQTKEVQRIRRDLEKK